MAHDGSILVVEDNRVNRKVFEAMISRLGYTVDMVENGQEALNRLAEGHHYDLIFLDCHMPVMDGYEASRRIRLQEGKGGGIPIIAMTADIYPETRTQCLESGMNDFLTKPVTLDAIRDVILKWLSQ